MQIKRKEKAMIESAEDLKIATENGADDNDADGMMGGEARNRRGEERADEKLSAEQTRDQFSVTTRSARRRMPCIMRLDEGQKEKKKKKKMVFDSRLLGDREGRLSRSKARLG
jgi:hypothetical protein